MKIKSGVWYWLAVASGAVGLLYGLGLEGSFQTGGTVSDADFITAMVLILLAIFFMRLGFYAADQEKKRSKKVHQQPRNTVKSGTTNIAGITGRIMKNLPASCGTPSGTQRPAICWHPARPRCVPGGWATRARTALRLPSAMDSAAAIELTSTHLRGNVSTAARWTACRRYALYEKSPPVRQHRRAARDDEFERLHHPDDITKSEVLQ